MIRTSSRAALLCVLLLLGGASAQASSAFDQATARQRLGQFGILPSGFSDALLPNPINRTTLVGHLIAGLQKNAEATMLNGTPSFEDVDPNAWYSGTWALAKMLGIAVSNDGRIYPHEQMTAAEVLGFAVRASDVEPDNTQVYPENYIAPALAAGMLSEEQAKEIRAYGALPISYGLALAILDQAFYSLPFASEPSIYQALWVTADPTISVLAPQDGSKGFEEMPLFEGTAAAGQSHAYPLHLTLTLDGLTVFEHALSEEGTWAYIPETPLAFGVHTFSVQVTDFAGRSVTSPERTFEISEPPVSVSPPELWFGDQAVGTTSGPKLLTFWNDSSELLTVESVVMPPDFGLQRTAAECERDLMVEPGHACNLLVVFTPTEPGVSAPTLELRFIDASPVRVPLGGNGIGSNTVQPEPDPDPNLEPNPPAPEERGSGCAQVPALRTVALIALVGLALRRRRGTGLRR